MYIHLLKCVFFQYFAGVLERFTNNKLNGNSHTKFTLLTKSNQLKQSRRREKFINTVEKQHNTTYTHTLTYTPLIKYTHLQQKCLLFQIKLILNWKIHSRNDELKRKKNEKKKPIMTLWVCFYYWMQRKGHKNIVISVLSFVTLHIDLLSMPLTLLYWNIDECV